MVTRVRGQQAPERPLACFARMDLLLAACQGAGLALAAGAFAGASGRRSAIGWLLLAAAVIGAGVLFGLSLEEEDHPAYPGWPVGAALGALAFLVVRDFAAAAAGRAGEGGFTGAAIALVALVVAALSLVVPPVGVIALAALAYLAFARRGRAARKYEGLRTLR